MKKVKKADWGEVTAQEFDPRLYYICIRNALLFLGRMEGNPNLFFVVSSSNEKAGVRKIVQKAARKLGQVLITDDWVPGLLTNWQGVGKRSAVSGNAAIGQWRFPLKQGDPDMLVIVDAGETGGGKGVRLAINEGRKARIPMMLLTGGQLQADGPAQDKRSEFVIPIKANKETEVYAFLQALVRFSKSGEGFGSSGGRAED